MHLSELFAGLALSTPSADPVVMSVTEDSRRVGPGSVFVAVSGTRREGAAFVPEAIRRGAVAIVAAAHDAVEARVPLVRVASAREALATASARLAGEPAAGLSIIGFTGTFGKTTTSDVLRCLLEAAGTPTAVIGSLGARIGEYVEPPTGLTTPSPSTLHPMLRRLAGRGARTVVMEVTSHALLLERVAGLTFAHGMVGAILPGEHTDFHRSYAAYVEAKGRMLGHVARGGIVTYDRDNAAARRLVGAHTAFRLAGLSLSGRPQRDPGDLALQHVSVDRAGARFVVRGREVRSALLGRHNVRNVGMAVTMALAMGIDPGVVAAALPALRALRRRMQPLSVAGRDVVDDTAGHPESLAAAFEVAALFDAPRLLVAYALRGRRGVDVNASNAAALGDLVQLHDAAHLAVSASTDAVGEADRAEPDEIDATRRGLIARGTPFTWHDRLGDAIADVAGRSRPGDLILLLGAQGMDQGAELLRIGMG